MEGRAERWLINEHASLCVGSGFRASRAVCGFSDRHVGRSRFQLGFQHSAFCAQLLRVVFACFQVGAQCGHPTVAKGYREKPSLSASHGSMLASSCASCLWFFFFNGLHSEFAREFTG